MCACIRVFCLLFLSEQPMYECMYECIFSKRHACYELVICTLMCVISYNMFSPICTVLYIELQLSLSGGLTSTKVVKASSLFMYVYNKLTLPDFLRLFTNPMADITEIWDGLITCILSFKRRMFIIMIIPGIRISAGQEGII